ncbi:MAG TPA: thiamine phosphate synthase [Terriglobales bacterium]
MLLYYITDRKRFPGDETARREALLKKIAQAAQNGVDFIQLREKDLSGRELELLANDAVRAVRENSPAAAQTTRILINSRTDIALVSGADGVHLPADDISPGDVRSIWSKAAARCGRTSTPPLITLSCHSEHEVAKAASGGADYAIFAPVFEKLGAPSMTGAGLDALQTACQQSIPVLALGGVTLENATTCVQAGAVGIAAIRLFQENEITDVIKRLR